MVSRQRYCRLKGLGVFSVTLVCSLVTSPSVLARQAPRQEASVLPARNPANADPATAESARRVQALSYKAQGDLLVADERLDEAARAYLEALSLDREAFTPEERVEMAVYISWEDHLDEARTELEAVLDGDPGNVSARTHLARVYSWSGELSRSIDEADRVLDVDPNAREALLVKADALEWQGYFRKAIPVYANILASGDDFDARLGLSYALLSGGNRTEARANALRLSPETTRQTGQLEELADAIHILSRPYVDVRHNYYEDSDDNQHNRYSLIYGFGLGNSNFELRLARTDSRNESSTSRSRSAFLNVTSNLTEGVSVAGGIGVSKPGSGTQPNLMTGRLAVDSSISNGRFGVSVQNDVLIDTTELIENRIRMMNYGAEAAKPVSDRLSIGAAYSYRDFSDGNHAHDVRFSPEFIAVFSPRITLGYQIRFQDYHTQAGTGYFDPDNYFANRVSVSVYHETPRVYAYANLFGGQQSYTRNGFSTDDVVLGGAVSFGFSPVSALSVEFNGEGGNFAAGSVSGFTYFTFGSRVALTF